MAFGAVTGQVLDVVDVDPKNGGSVDEIRRGLAEADVYVLAEVGTPSDGVHFHIPATGLPTWRGKGVDFLGGTAEGESRAFRYVPPTIRPKYPTGGYRWLKEPEYHLLGKIRPEPAMVFVQRLHNRLGRPRAQSTFGQPGGVAVGHRGADLWWTVSPRPPRTSATSLSTMRRSTWPQRGCSRSRWRRIFSTPQPGPRNLSTLSGQFLVSIVESVVVGGAGRLIQVVPGSAGGSGCLRTNRSGVAA